VGIIPVVAMIMCDLGYFDEFLGRVFIPCGHLYLYIFYTLDYIYELSFTSPFLSNLVNYLALTSGTNLNPKQRIHPKTDK
jgi:hypothetical protein